jgi:uncharacterized protein involved in exopolysaccharide biosynthesis
MAKVFEILFRNKWKLLPLVLLPILLSGVVALLLPRSYQSTARLLAGQRYAVLGATGLESDLQSTPAMTQAAALTDLLQTESFCLAVANDTDLPKHIGVSRSNTAQLQDALYTEISSHVQVTAIGYQLYEITYANANPVVAMQVVKAVVSHFNTVSSSQATAEGEQLIASYQGQLKTAQAQAASTTQAAAQYMQQHNLTAATAQSDPQYQLLSQQADQARTALANVQANINSINQQLAMLNNQNGGLFNVIDAPTAPDKPVSRTKTFLLVGGIGLAIGLLACISYFLVLVRLDQAVYSSADVLTLSEYPVLIEIPRLPHRSATWIAGANGNLLTEKK